MTAYRHRPASLLRGRGVEIGALHRPLKVPRGARVTYVDRLPLEQLKEHYPELPADELTPVDVLGSAEDLSAFADESLDFVIANHLIEHLEDPVKGLKEFHRVLKPHGLLFMCVPDCRVTFDRHRELTPTEHILGEHRGGPGAIAANRRAHYEDWVDNVENKDVEGVARPGQPQGRDERVEFLMEMDYSIHFHVWHAPSFIEFFREVCRAEGLRFEILQWIETAPLGHDELILLAGKDPTAGQRARARYQPGLRLDRNLKEMLRVTPVGPHLVRAYRLVRRRKPS